MSKPILHMIIDDDAPEWAKQHARMWGEYANVTEWTFDLAGQEVGVPYYEFAKKVEDKRLRSNFLRHNLLARHGGAYADWDTHPVRNPFRIEEWEGLMLFAPQVTNHPHMDNCFMYADGPGHPVAKTLVDLLDFEDLVGRHIHKVVGKNPGAVRLPSRWNCASYDPTAVINHYYAGGSMTVGEFRWLADRVAGKKVVEAGCGLMSIDLSRICTLESVEHDRFFADRVISGGHKHVVLEEGGEGYVGTFARKAMDADAILVDGMHRVWCLESSRKVPVAYLHDAYRDDYRYIEGWKVVEECPGSARGLVRMERA